MCNVEIATLSEHIADVADVDSTQRIVSVGGNNGPFDAKRADRLRVNVVGNGNGVTERGMIQLDRENRVTRRRSPGNVRDKSRSDVSGSIPSQSQGHGKSRGGEDERFREHLQSR